MIWFKINSFDAKRAVVYTSKEDIAQALGMVKKRRGKFWYKVISSKYIRYALGLRQPNKRNNYMKMIWQYPDAALYVARREKIPPDIKARMEADMGWNPETKTFNEVKRLNKEN